jgi:hypothetical protein
MEAFGVHYAMRDLGHEQQRSDSQRYMIIYLPMLKHMVPAPNVLMDCRSSNSLYI